MEKTMIAEFLNKRDSRTTTIEIANTLYQKLGTKNLNNNIQHATFNNFDAGCVINYFAFTQKTLVDFIFMNFITIIGNYNTKNDSLKAWAKIPFPNEDNKNITMSKLKHIRARYADARNNSICHINDDIQACTSSVHTHQINQDVIILRKIFNEIRHNNSIPPVITTYAPSEHYPVIGVDKLIAVVSTSFFDTETNIPRTIQELSHEKVLL